MNEQPSEDDEGVQAVRRVFAFIAIFLVVVSQIFIYTTAPARDNLHEIPYFFWISITGMVVGVLLFLWSQIYRPGRAIRALITGLELNGPMGWVTVSIVFTFLAVLTMQLFPNAGRTNYLPVLIFWLAAAICYVAGFVRNVPSLSACWEWAKLHRYELLGIGLITLLGLVLRFYKLGEIPRVINGDEGRIGLMALSTRAEPYANPFALWENFGALYLQAINYTLAVFGVSPFALRLLPAIGGTLAIPALYLLARQITGVRIAMLAACLLAFSHTHIHFSRTVAVAYIQGTLLIALELYLLLSGLEKRSSWRTALAGVLLAIHFSIYLDSQIIAALILVYMLLAFLFLRSWFKPALDQAFAFWGGFGIMILPEFVFAWNHPIDFFNRLNRDGTFNSGWLANEVTITGYSAAQILAERVIHAFLGLIYYPAFDFYGSPVSALSLISATLFLLGLGIVFLETRSPGFLLLNGYFWAGTVAIGTFSIPMSADTYRMLIVLPAAVIMAAIGLDRILYALGAGWATQQKLYTSAAALTLFSIFAFNIWAYYYQFASNCLYGTDDGPTRFASYLGNYVRTLDTDDEIYLLSDPLYFYGTHQSVDFLSNHRFMTNFGDPLDLFQLKPDQVLIAVPSRIQELRTWTETHPGGKLHYEDSCGTQILVAYEYFP